jgi:ferric-dicitrate binding protein FerR (iron transport regulator)
MEPNKFNKLLNRYLKGDANETEIALIDAWYKSYQSVETNVKIDVIEKEYTRQAIKYKIREAIHPNKRQNFFQIQRLGIAASILLICASVLILNYNQHQAAGRKLSYSIIKTGVGSQKKIVLPDRSVVWLNTASTIRIPSAFNGIVREVFLEEGEAFFEVKKNPKRPFIVHASSLDVRVLGTSFNIRSYRTINDQKVYVTTGRVSVSAGKQIVGILTPGQQLSYNSITGKNQIDLSNSRLFTAWRNGTIYMNQVSFRELAMVLHNTYGLTLRPGSEKANSYRFTFLLNSFQPIDKTLKMISMIHNTHYRREVNDIIIY